MNQWAASNLVTEGVHLRDEGVDPYAGDLFHESPLGLVAYGWLIRGLSSWLGPVFVACDLATAHLLYCTARCYMAQLRERQARERCHYATDCEALLLKEEGLELAPVYVASAYLFNPYNVLSCVGMTTTVFANLCLAATFLFMVQGRRLPCCFFLAVATLQSLYPAVLLVPASIYVARQAGHMRLDRQALSSACLTCLAFLAMLGALLWACWRLTRSWDFLAETYGFILNVPDLRPNIGLFWYFFTEMFEHFRPLFVCAFQINAAALYAASLALRLHAEPMLLAASLTALSAVFRSYPGLGDVGFYLALLPMWKHLFNYMQQGFVVGCFFLITSVLAPIVWHLWIYSRSANANFYFGVTLAFATAQIFLITDILFAYIKREFSLYHGLRRELNGKPAKLVLE
ncbi:phosphatidylinositol glycan anchor biosynthesis class U protein isoform X2 [Bacillus rossius redtenbacheri]|uniref:phosphatidylinositol glycan anchor biosynthesis class U protein isoform X2 n=1 Tax=Bacillus rossius redtenbacheri TaxID=93214 RepID=UPI002FDD2F6D